jgi:UPF0042 nucleotide-binding protein
VDLKSQVEKQKIIIVSGLSGSGKSTALAAFEDAGFYCVDNMPVVLLPHFLTIPIESRSDIAGLAFVMDLREKSFLSEHRKVFSELKQQGHKITIIYMEADEPVLLQRYSQSRRNHPAGSGMSPIDGIRKERKLLNDLKKSADTVIDTSGFNVHELKVLILNIAQKMTSLSPMRINLMSFGFKFGIPINADLVIDVRFLVNPYFIPELKELDGESREVSDFVLQNSEARLFLKKYLDLLDYLIPLYEKEGKAYLTLAVGCTGGRHRSVAIARALFDHIHQSGKQVEITHRDINQ